ncbi:MAG: hypothetical protein KA191_16075 [Verrucomicrobia bacterium]|jgi:hypothetical protein|nr:hypothetical protein [Verrucomicrobiota bacterium]
MSKPKLGYLLFDLPSDHEVEEALATECKVIESLIHNMRLKARVKRVCVASIEKFTKYPTYRYQVQFVHLACHGGKDGIGMLGGTMRWTEVARQITKHLHKLKDDQKRVMVFSCCHSSDGFHATRMALKDYFTGAYYFSSETVSFSDAITIWTMFYRNKRLAKPHGAIVKVINEFLGKNLLVFRSYEMQSTVQPP